MIKTEMILHLALGGMVEEAEESATRNDARDDQTMLVEYTHQYRAMPQLQQALQTAAEA